MAEKKTKATKETTKKSAQKQEQRKQEKPNTILYVGIAVAIVVIAGAIYFIASNYVAIPFSTFKSNFQSAQRVALTFSYPSGTNFSTLYQCISPVVQNVAHSRNLSTIDFFIISQANATCTYSPTGLGAHATVGTQPASKCVSVANSEPGVFINYSTTNSTSITLYHLYVYGNSQYLATCPIAAQLG